MTINKINNVSFGAKLILDRDTRAFMRAHNQNEVAEFNHAISKMGNKSDIVEIKDLYKHQNSVALVDRRENQYTDCNAVYAESNLTKYSADVYVNGVHNKVEIIPNSTLRANLPLKQLAGIISNELYGKINKPNVLCNDISELKAYTL